MRRKFDYKERQSRSDCALRIYNAIKYSWLYRENNVEETPKRKWTFSVVCSTWREKNSLLMFLPTTVGSKSTKTARGTCLPAPVSLKNVLKESSPPPMVLSLGIWPSGWIPCSKQYNSQQAFPIWTPAWPTWTEIHSRCATKFRKSGCKRSKFCC